MWSIRAAKPDDREAMFGVWWRSVQVTHDFVSGADLQRFRPMVRAYLASDEPVFSILENGADAIAGFMGLSGAHLDALFLAPEWLGQGGGRMLVDHARRCHAGLTVDVNEQNVQACRFYRACGFVVTGRSALDGTGCPYPLLHMRLAPAAHAADPGARS